MSKYAQQVNKCLLSLKKDKNSEQFDNLFDITAGHLMGVASLYLVNKDLAEEVVSESYIKVLKIVSFTNPYNASTNYQLSLNDPSALSAVITDKFSNVLSTTSTSQDGKVIYSFDIGANETCYVQFLGNADANSSAILAVNSKQLKWIINGKPCSNNTKLKPNSQNTIELNIESDGKLLDVVKNFTISTTIKDYRHWEGQLYIGEVENGSEMHIIPVCAVDYTCIVIVDDMIRNITLMHCNGTQNFDKVNVELGQTIRGAAMPQWTGHKFMGYFTGENGQGDEYINQDMQSVVWDENKTCDTLFAYWEVNTYTLTYSYETEYGTREFKVDIKYNDPIPSAYKFAPSLAGHEFEGYFSEDGKRQFYRMEIINDEQGAAIQGGGYILVEGMVPIGNYDIADDITIKARFKLLSCNYAYENYIVEGESYTYNSSKSISLTHGVTFNLTPMEIEGYNFDHFYINGKGNVTDIPTAYTPNLYRSSADAKIYPRNYIMCYYTKNCVAQGTLITLADGTQVPVETLTGNEMLMVWNMITGRLEAASILFIDKDPAQVYKVINLGFSDGTTVKVISEHGFWDYDLNKYVYLRQDASKYIGHWFNKGETRVQLVSVDVRDEYTSSYSPVTYGHLCYYVNGMLSMPGGISGLFNIFEVNPDTMTINLEAMDRDIALYGLYTYDEFAELVPVSEDVFNAFNGQYLKVAVGKGLITVEQLNNLASRYAEFFV